MLIFIDESGFPHPKDDTLRPVLAALCLPETQHRRFSRQLHAIKNKFLDNPSKELKAKELLRPYIFEKKPRRREMVESVFDLVRQTDGLAIYASVMEKPASMPTCPETHIPIQYRRLLERIHFHTDTYGQIDESAIILFDGEGTSGIKGGLGPGISAYLFRSSDGQKLTRIITTPFFVDSKITLGVQVADMIAGCIRLSEERDENDKMNSSPHFKSAILRFRKIINEKTNNFETDWTTLYGLNYIPERELYEETKNNYRP